MLVIALQYVVKNEIKQISKDVIINNIKNIEHLPLHSFLTMSNVG